MVFLTLLKSIYNVLVTSNTLNIISNLGSTLMKLTVQALANSINLFILMI